MRDRVVNDVEHVLGVKLDEIPLVLQYNKRDLANILSLAELEDSLNPEKLFESYEACAVLGQGVFETLKAISRLTLRSLKKRMLGEEKAPVSAPAPKAAPAAAAAPVEPGEIPHEVVKLSNMRKTIARRLTEAKQTIPHIYLTVDIQLDALLKLRSELNKGLEARGIKLSVNDLLIKALAVALIEVPECNVSFAGDNLIKYSRADVSVAVSIPGGLITPIVANADGKSVSAIATEMKDLAARAKDGKLQPEEYQGGTASISNMGMYGIKQFDAVINPPQAMIMAIGAGEKRPYVINDSLQIATVMSATGSFDHRAIDGADGAKLMQAFKRLVENPLGMLA